MSLYNMLFGANKMGPYILATLGLTVADVGRFRDCYVAKVLGDYRIVIHTRMGGGNREDYEAEIESLRANPFYVADEDDDFDSTYADFYFALPPEYADELRELADQQNFVAPSEKWQALFSSMNGEGK